MLPVFRMWIICRLVALSARVHDLTGDKFRSYTWALKKAGMKTEAEQRY